MEQSRFLAFVRSTALMIALPGPSVLLTVTHSAAFGFRRGLVTVAGETEGIAVQLGVAVIGLSSLVRIAADILGWDRWAGAAYLAFLGIRLWIGAGRAAVEDPGAGVRVRPASSLFTQGLVVTLPNPKSLVFIAVFLPQFMDAALPLGPQFALIVPVFLAITFTVTSVWAWVASRAGAFLKGGRGLMILTRSAAMAIVIAGVGMALGR